MLGRTLYSFADAVRTGDSGADAIQAGGDEMVARTAAMRTRRSVFHPVVWRLMREYLREPTASLKSTSQGAMMHLLLENKFSVIDVTQTNNGKTSAVLATALGGGKLVYIPPTLTLRASTIAALNRSPLDKSWVSYPWSDGAKATHAKVIVVDIDSAASDGFLQWLQAAARVGDAYHPLHRIVFDEAHELLLSPSFRRAFLAVRRAAETPHVQFVLLSATCSHLMRDALVTCMDLSWKSVRVISSEDEPHPSVSRPELKFAVKYAPPKDTPGDNSALFAMVASELETLSEGRTKCGVIYCASRETAKDLAAYLGLPVVHGKSSPEEKKMITEAWLQGRDGFRIIVATATLGAGIDNKACTFVLHAGSPRTIGEYIQEAGRAGRWGSGAIGKCTLIFDGYVAKPEFNAADVDAAPGLLDAVGWKEMKEYCRRDANRLCRRTILTRFMHPNVEINCYAIPQAQLCDLCEQRYVGRPSPIGTVLSHVLTLLVFLYFLFLFLFSTG